MAAETTQAVTTAEGAAMVAHATARGIRRALLEACAAVCPACKRGDELVDGDKHRRRERNHVAGGRLAKCHAAPIWRLAGERDECIRIAAEAIGTDPSLRSVARELREACTAYQSARRG
jgi:hypothetical protein